MVLEGFTPYPPELAREYREKGYWQGLTVGDLLDRAVEAHPDRAALVDEKGKATYRELAERVERIEEFPLTPVGKIAKKVLREWIARQIEEGREIKENG